MPTPNETIDPQGLAGRPVYLVDPLTGDRVELVGGAVPTTGGGGGGTVNQGTPNTPSNAWPVKPTDAAGVNQQAITAAGDAKVTLDSEAVVLGAGSAKVGAVDLDSDATPGSAVPGTAQYVAGTDGTNARGLKTDAGGELQVSPQGRAAHDAAAVGNPVLVGAQMETMADSAPGTRASTDGDASKLATTDGALFAIPTGAQLWSYHQASSAIVTDGSVHAAPGAGLSIYVQTIVVSTGSATAFNIFFEEGSTTVLGPYYLEAVAGRGLVINFLAPKKITANTELLVTTSAAIAHSIDITGFIAPG